MGLKLNPIKNPKLQFNQISPNTRISNSQDILSVLEYIPIKLIQLYGESSIILQYRSILLDIYRYIGLERGILQNIRLRRQRQLLQNKIESIKQQHLKINIIYKDKPRYTISYSQVNKNLEVQQTISQIVPQDVIKLTSVFQKRTQFFDRHFFNLTAIDDKITQLNLLYFDSQYRNSITKLVQNAGQAGMNTKIKLSSGKWVLPNKIIGQVFSPPRQMIRYVNKQNLNWQVVHPPFDMCSIQVTNSEEQSSIICKYQGKFSANIGTKYEYTPIGNKYSKTFNIKNSDSIQKFSYQFQMEDRKLINTWPSVRNTELLILSKQSELIRQMKQFKPINNSKSYFSKIRSILHPKPQYHTNDNYLAWLQCQLHRGVYYNEYPDNLDGYIISPAWYAHSYTNYDLFRGIYKNIFAEFINVIDKTSGFDKNLILSDDRLLPIFMDASTFDPESKFGTIDQHTNLSRFGQDIYDKQFVTSDTHYYDFNIFPPLYNVIAIPQHPEDFDYNEQLRLSQTASLGLSKFYHPNRYICIPDILTRFNNALMHNQLQLHIPLRQFLSQYSQILNSNVSILQRKQCHLIKRDQIAWPADSNAYYAKLASDTYRNGLNDIQYSSSVSYPISDVVSSIPIYQNTNIQQLDRLWRLYLYTKIDKIESFISDSVLRYLYNIDWSYNYIYNQNVRSVSWQKSLYMQSNASKQFITKLNDSGINTPQLYDKGGYYNSLIPNYLLSQKVSIIQNQVYNDHDYRYWKYYNDSETMSYSKSPQQQFINYTYSNNSFSQKNGRSNTLAIIYTDNHKGSNYGFMSEIGVYEVQFKTKYALNNRILTPSDVSMLYTTRQLQMNISPYLGIQQLPSVISSATMSILPYQYVDSYKRLYGFFNTEFDQYWSKRTGQNRLQMCSVTDSQFMFNLSKYGQFLTFITGDKHYFQCRDKTYFQLFFDILSIQYIEQQQYLTTKLILDKKFQGNTILSWLRYQNINDFSADQIELQIRDVTVSYKGLDYE